MKKKKKYLTQISHSMVKQKHSVESQEHDKNVTMTVTIQLRSRGLSQRQKSEK